MDNHGCGCHPIDTKGPPIPYVDNQHVVVLIDKNPGHRSQIKSALISMYNILEADHTEGLIEFLRETRPAMVLVNEEGNSKGYETVRRIRKDTKVHDLPTLLFLQNDDERRVAAAEECGASSWLPQPYKRSTLINAISAQLNREEEDKWSELPAMQSRALKGTVDIFNSLSDVIDKGEPIAYGKVRDACTPLVEAVNADSFKGILNGVKNHDNYTYAHSLRVAVFLSLFGRTIGLPMEDQKILATGGLLHDVGKMLIPHLVLNKPGRLTAQEFEVMKGHVNSSVKILEKSPEIPKGVIIIAAQHHEKLDGTGYPNGLSGTQLNELARMASIVDVFGALTDRRVYKPSMTPENALKIMQDEMANHLDMRLLATFRQMLLDASIEDEL